MISISCESKYTRMVKNELNKNLDSSELFLGFNFGFNKSDFFELCWKLNKEGKIVQGPKNKKVQYIIPPKKNGKSEIRLLFYGIFDKEEKMVGMDLDFSFESFAIWSEQFNSKNLKPHVIDILMEWFPGNEFVSLEKKNAEIEVKVDGNRQILVYIKDDKTVYVKIENLLEKIKNKGIRW